MLAAPEAAVGENQRAAFDDLVEQRSSGRPVSYLRGLKEFYGIILSVDERALVPRPETEQLVDLALERLTQYLTRDARPAGTPPLQVWDVGTGCGPIAVALAVESRRRGYAPDVRVLATDVSSDALALAIENAVAHGVADVVDLRVADLADLADVPMADLLLANLPYIPTDVVPTLPVAASFEPALALDGGSDGLAVIGRLIDELPRVLSADGAALLEIGADQEPALRDLVAHRLPEWRCTVHLDLAGRPRVAELSREVPSSSA